MRSTPLIAAVAAIALTAACSRTDNAASGVAHNPDVRNAEASFKQAGHTAAQDFRKLAVQAKAAAHKLAADTRGAAHDVTKRDRSDDKSS